MRISRISKTHILFLILIVVLAFWLRLFNITTVPRHGATFDEFAWTWLGINLIQKGVPISWSPHPQYKEREHLRYQGAAFWIVKPYLEHPPFFGLVAGSFAILSGVKDMYHVTLEKIRPLALGLGMLSVIMVFLLTRELYGNIVAFIATLLYSTVPTIVIGSRIVQNENFLIPFWLLALYLIHKYLQTQKRWMRNVASIIGGLLILAKVPWLVASLSLGMILFYKGRWRDALFVGVISVGFLSLFIVYGIYFDKQLFLDLWKLQAARYDISFDGLYSIFTNPLLVDRHYLDGWIIFGWFSIFLLLKDAKQHLFVLLPFIAYLIFYVFAIPNEPAHGWYRYPFYPLLAVSSAVVLQQEWKKLSFVSIFFLFIVGLALLHNVWRELFGFSLFVYRAFILFTSIPILYLVWKNKNERVSKLLLLFWFVIFILFNILSVVVYKE